jgi:hypothetical protein
METTVITCTCTVCNGLSARIRGEVTGSPKTKATKIHNLVGIAHSPLAKSASAQRFGPWAV